MTATARLNGLMLLVLLSGCASAGPTRYFSLSPQSGPAVAYAGPPIQLRRLTLPPQLNRLELVDHRGENEIVVRDFARWAAPLPDLARAVLEVDLARRLPEGQVIVSEAVPAADAAPLSVAINALRQADGRWVLRGAWTLGGGAPLSGVIDLSTQAAATGLAGQDPNGDPAAISALLGQLADVLAARLAGAARLAR